MVDYGSLRVLTAMILMPWLLRQREMFWQEAMLFSSTNLLTGISSKAALCSPLLYVCHELAIGLQQHPLVYVSCKVTSVGKVIKLGIMLPFSALLCTCSLGCVAAIVW